MSIRGVRLLVAAQFVSGLADNALLVVAIACLMQRGEAAWLAPLLKLVFTVAYVVLAPCVGVVADRWPKERVMLAANLLKACAALAMLLGLHPLAAFCLAGPSAACYSPAKYGLVTERVPPAALVRANGWLEVSTVGAIILGTALGGWLVSDGFAALWGEGEGGGLQVALLAVMAVYLAAGVLNGFIPRRPAAGASSAWRLPTLLSRFGLAQGVLWRDRAGGLSLGVTTLFWGAGATLQFVVLAWAQQSLALGLDQAAYLQAVVAVGIAAGAALAGRWVSLAQAPRVLPLGVLIGLAVPLMLLVESVAWAIPLLAAVGFASGAFVVPMNALLQHRGHVLLSPGESIAVQNFNENLSVLLMLGAYTLLLALGGTTGGLIAALGLLVAGCTALAGWRWHVSHRALQQADSEAPLQAAQATSPHHP
ncbi:MFS family permease [Acidovorax soli]|uniref:MFS family permease n=1 Tax=Acidovorax soli TaxID=592050 RepID=A0A7X0PHN9_9BURK|nr:lysophospholipid transporter LplT [Acidovorax soli]MBB6561784.1 MFS family permease [Acidovorax soli]